MCFGCSILLPEVNPTPVCLCMFNAFILFALLFLFWAVAVESFEYITSGEHLNV